MPRTARRAAPSLVDFASPDEVPGFLRRDNVPPFSPGSLECPIRVEVRAEDRRERPNFDLPRTFDRLVLHEATWPGVGHNVADPLKLEDVSPQPPQRITLGSVEGWAWSLGREKVAGGAVEAFVFAGGRWAVRFRRFDGDAVAAVTPAWGELRRWCSTREFAAEALRLLDAAADRLGVRR